MNRSRVVIGAAVLGAWCGTSAGYDRPDTTDRWDGNASYRFDFDSDIPSYGLRDDPDNVELSIDLNAHFGTPAGSPVTVHGFSWSVQIEAFAPSQLQNMILNIASEPVGPFTVLFMPGHSYAESGVLSKSGSVSFSDLWDDVLVLSEGILRLRFSDVEDDIPNAPDGVWRGGPDYHITFDVTVVPAPHGAMVLALSGCAAARRRARR